MKCIQCGAHARLRERKDGRCPRCRHPFAFEPTTDPSWTTDAQFKNAIERVSGDGKVRFSERNLWYEVHRRWALRGVVRQPTSLFWAAVVGAVVGALPGVVLAKLFAVPALYWLSAVGAVGMGALTVYANWRANTAPPFSHGPPSMRFEVFQKQHLPRWIEVNGPIPGLLPPREEAAAAMPRQVPPDVAAFSFDRALVTDRWETAAMLVANRFHFEHNCAVLSVDGYPDGIADTIKEMLRRNPRLTVFALHDASLAGCHLPFVLREPAWFPDPRVRIVDLGLRPEIAKRLRLPEFQGSSAFRPPELMETLSPEDQQWLTEGHSSELAALRPTQLMRAAYKGIVAAGPHDGSVGIPATAGALYGGGMIWIGDPAGGADTAAVDGFG
jgi:hypothetical protein